ncbi:Sapep family Mn(2+)-dependent dipeptidase [Aminicella lysinilytica]|jgi:succinyl-diaminopimelate desuccinylase|uniref:Sapep family Mn(2+)-dependent dipeptidase n=1 Tax=Aminicella lysinilytica TaxID=433323 RepID=UPI0026EDB274|nr:Sapep family Mn(2+)-dependent dipeptidase [Aminicella lysinilytica]
MAYFKNDNMIKDLGKLIAFQSISKPSDDPDNPFGEETHMALEYCLQLCEQLGMRVKRCGNYLGYAEIGEGTELMGILVHVDVVPPGEGWLSDPFKLTEEDGRIYGRGVIDDKGPAMMCIYAMYDLLSSESKIDRRIRLIFGCSEENGNWEDMDYYKAHEELPDFGFTADADFPVVYAEKGILVLKLSMDSKESGIFEAEGALAPNIVPGHCKLKYYHQGDKVTVEGEGKAAHGSTPWEGVNAIGLAMQKAKGKFADFYNEKIAMSWDGKLLNCDFHDDVTGGITINPGMISVDDAKLQMTLDIRYPVTFKKAEIVNRIIDEVQPYGICVDILASEDPLYVDKGKAFVKNLIKAYRTVTKDDAEPIVMGGGTYAKSMDNIVAFGPNFPGQPCSEHQPNENASVEELYKGREIYRLAMAMH